MDYDRYYDNDDMSDNENEVYYDKADNSDEELNEEVDQEELDDVTLDKYNSGTAENNDV